MKPTEGTTILLVPGPLNNRQSGLKLGEVGQDGIISTIVQAENLDFDNKGLGTRRKGRTLAYSGAPHSLWSHPKKLLAFFVEGTSLKLLNTDYTATSISTLNTSEEMRFEVVGTEVVGTNGIDIGWVEESGFTAFSQPLKTFEKLMPAGQFLAYDFGDSCLLVAKDNVIYKSKPHNAEVMDERYSQFPFDGGLRMLGVVEDGWWVATEKSVGFVQRAEADSFTFRNVSENPPPSGCFLSGWEETEGGKKLYVAWASVDGFCMGRANGEFTNLSKNVALPTGNKGRMFWRVNNGIEQFIAVIYTPSGARKFTQPTMNIKTIQA